ncbi:MAG: ABC-F family ATP-binding cassette domain-containing protein [Phycisphaerales bacterium]
MPILAGTNIAHAYGHDVVLDGVSVSVEPGERVGLVGRNGTGKSTLLKILAGLFSSDSGSVTLQRGARASYLKQDPDLDPDESLRDAAEGAFAELHALHQELESVFEKMGESEGAALEKLLREQERLEKAIEAAGGYAIDHKIDAVLHGLGFDDSQFKILVRDLSGGQKGRLALARLLLEGPDVLLLDEPTNHLDLAGREWLEEFLRDEYKGAVLMVSHDRYLLDRVVHRIVEVEQGRLIEYPGNYRAFRKLRAERREAQLRAYERQQTEFKREEAFIRKYKAGQRAKQARGRESRLERAKEASTLERPMELAELRLSLAKAERAGDIVVAARELSKKYLNEDGSEKVLFHDLDVKIGRGERWGIIGPNGAGKTTLVRTLLGEASADSGAVQLGSKLSVGYFRQTDEGLDPDKIVYRQMQDLIKKETDERVVLSEQEARNLAGAFLFSGLEQEKEIGVLSGGERARVRLAALLASAKNVLVLDEPTNHLDIPSAERLEEALAKPDPDDAKKGGAFEGTLILISHDRALIDATCDHLLVLDGSGGAEVYPGGYSAWHERSVRRREDATEARREDQKRAPATPVPSAGNGLTGTKKRDDAAKGKFSWMPLDKIEERIGVLESQIREIDRRLADPDVWSDPARANALTDERDRLTAELEPLEAEWLRKAE